MSTNSKGLKTSAFEAHASGGSKKLTPAQPTPTADGGDSSIISAVHIPLIKNKYNTKLLPTYTAALQRSAEDYLAAEDLDSIQLELETLLSNVASRYRVLKSEYESLDKDDRRNERRLKPIGGEKTPVSPAPTNSNNGKRKRDESSSSVRKPKHTTVSTLKHNKHAKMSAHTDDSMDYAAVGHGSHGHGHKRDHHLQKMTLPKNDTPNKFWLSVEPYSMPLTNEDLRLLDDLLDQYAGPLVPPVPELGPHYATVWAAEDLKEVQQSSNSSSNHLKQQNSATSANMMKKADAMMEECVTGPLTQRLVSALMEEQLLQNAGDVTAAVVGYSSNSSSENTQSSHLSLRSLSILRNCIGIEKRVKKELIEHGILGINDFTNNDDDEIHSEIKRLIAELSTIADYNNTTLKNLHEAASEEIKRLEIKRKLDTVDQEILETYKRTMQNKSKRKVLSAEEQQEIYRLTAEQKALSDQLERLQPISSYYE